MTLRTDPCTYSLAVAGTVSKLCTGTGTDTASGITEIDNNLVERMMRPIAVGRNNWLFAGSHGGARNAALFFSLINSCKLNKVNSYDYLRDVITRIDHTQTMTSPLYFLIAGPNLNSFNALSTMESTGRVRMFSE